ncbi:MAG: response regulator [Flavisolibacter sp.]|nr:response regulator [Flavisolibacter sp.]
MSKNHPILIVEDDVDDQDILKEVFHSLEIPNELKFFNRCPDLLDYLRTTTDRPLIILTDVNLPVMSGIELRMEICKDEYLRRKSIPFVFLTTSNSIQAIEKAYDLNVQGYFIKEDNFNAIKSMIRQIIDYWVVCKHPNII